MARKFIVKPWLMTHLLTIGDEEEEVIDYGSERFFPYPSGAFQRQGPQAPGQTASLTGVKPDVRHRRRKNDIFCCQELAEQMRRGGAGQFK